MGSPVQPWVPLLIEDEALVEIHTGAFRVYEAIPCTAALFRSIFSGIIFPQPSDTNKNN